MQIAVLGATSQIAKDWIVSATAHGQHSLSLYARRPDAVQQWLDSVGLAGRYAVQGYASFAQASTTNTNNTAGATNSPDFDAILNFVGVGDPARALAMGASIFEVTAQYDSMALNYLQTHPACRYLFLSSGAAYGTGFEQPVNASTPARIPLNNLLPQNWYGVAKLHAECRHRALPERAIVDLRVFNYFSHTQDMGARFFITDLWRALQQKTVLQTSAEPMVRDYLHPADFHHLVDRLLAAPPHNLAVDCYSQAPVDKTTLLTRMQKEFGLRYAISPASSGGASPAVNSTGSKPHYYSTDRRLADFGYQPRFSSCDGLLHEFRLMLDAAVHAG